MPNVKGSRTLHFRRADVPWESLEIFDNLP